MKSKGLCKSQLKGTGEIGQGFFKGQVQGVVEEKS